MRVLQTGPFKQVVDNMSNYQCHRGNMIHSAKSHIVSGNIGVNVTFCEFYLSYTYIHDTTCTCWSWCTEYCKDKWHQLTQYWHLSHWQSYLPFIRVSAYVGGVVPTAMRWRQSPWHFYVTSAFGCRKWCSFSVVLASLSIIPGWSTWSFFLCPQASRSALTRTPHPRPFICSAHTFTCNFRITVNLWTEPRSWIFSSLGPILNSFASFGH